MKTENQKRAKRCAATIRSYNADPDEPTNLIDFLADARHWCDHNDESYAELDRQAYQHYLAELCDERRQS